MTKAQPNLITRSDTMLGVCQALGEDFGVSPNLLRLGFAGMVIFNVGYAIAAYLGIGLLVAIVRFVHPARRTAAAPASVPVSMTEPGDRSTETPPVPEEALEDEALLVAA